MMKTTCSSCYFHKLYPIAHTAACEVRNGYMPPQAEACGQYTPKETVQPLSVDEQLAERRFELENQLKVVKSQLKRECIEYCAAFDLGRKDSIQNARGQMTKLLALLDQLEDDCDQIDASIRIPLHICTDCGVWYEDGSKSKFLCPACWEVLGMDEMLQKAAEERALHRELAAALVERDRLTQLYQEIGYNVSLVEQEKIRQQISFASYTIADIRRKLNNI